MSHSSEYWEAVEIGASNQVAAAARIVDQLNSDAARHRARQAQVANMTGGVALSADNYYFVPTVQPAAETSASPEQNSVV